MAVAQKKSHKESREARIALQTLLAEKNIAYVDKNYVLHTYDRFSPEVKEIVNFISNNRYLFNGELFGKRPIIKEASKDEVQTALAEAIIQDSGNKVADITQIANRTKNLLETAVNQGISDIHIRIFDRSLFFGRQDGIIKTLMMPQDRTYGKSMLSYMFMRLARESWNEHGDFDGRFDMTVDKKGVGEITISWRISQIPSVHGPKVTIRNLDASDVGESLDALGLNEGQCFEVNRLFSSQDGLFLLSGPTGSGKTTTINTALDTVAKAGDKIIQTFEDPVEWSSKRPNLIQTEVRPGQKVSEDSDKFKDFAYFGKKALRGDTDLVYVGEIRDNEVAMLALRMADTGQFCVSTTHTNSALASVSTFIEQFDVKPSLLAAPGVLRGLAHQRLTRKVCNSCGLTHDMAQERANNGDEHYINAIKSAEKYVARYSKSEEQEKRYRSQLRFRDRKGCSLCNNGLRGRTAVFELIIVEEEDRKFIKNNDMSGWAEYLNSKGMPTIYDHAAEKVIEGHCDVLVIESMLSDMTVYDVDSAYKSMNKLR
ncbi:Flp pilus assembly complex ATPase component TadA [Vibrio sp. Y2-5]|uniref:GspE/PulE family protein n=1 Tax=Vibrio sp. Y2-5 TaxID=2743977 RepID=UPI0016605054|nr:ATPase, T2SS/T4P/T4SS family [Vibrio sp. Y2-5]MBD0788061.1 Flp pilus assembly complex ATPase component TadA [Vibrio sp. Y2-5]